MALDGRYKISGEAMGISLDGLLTLKTVGAKLQGSVEVQGTTLPLENLAAKGNRFSGTVRAGTPMGDMNFKLAGGVTGDRIEGTLKALMVNARFSGARV